MENRRGQIVYVLRDTFSNAVHITVDLHRGTNEKTLPYPHKTWRGTTADALPSERKHGSITGGLFTKLRIEEIAML